MEEGFSNAGAIGINAGGPMFGFRGWEQLEQSRKPLLVFFSLTNGILSSLQGAAGSLTIQNLSLDKLFSLPPTPISGKIPSLFSAKSK